MSTEAGVVTLVGAGPGDPDLLTVGAVRALSRADVVVYDNLICPEILDYAPDAEKINVGKLPYGKQTAQETIHSILVREGSLGKNVVRLKGGDPFIFGRGTEELEVLHRAGIPFRFLPGVSSLNGVFGPAGVALTTRGRNHGFAVFSGSGATDSSEFARWAEYPGPVVVYMGVRRAAEIAEAFLTAGRNPHEPVVIVSRGGTPAERILQTRLRELSTVLSNPTEWTPAIFAIGVERERAFALRPLDGKVAALQAAQLDGTEADQLRALGAIPARATKDEPSHPFAREVSVSKSLAGK